MFYDYYMFIEFGLNLLINAGQSFQNFYRFEHLLVIIMISYSGFIKVCNGYLKLYLQICKLLVKKLLVFRPDAKKPCSFKRRHCSFEEIYYYNVG